MKKQTNQQQQTQGKTTNHVSNKDKQQTSKTLLSPKAGYVQHASLFSNTPTFSYETLEHCLSW